MGLPALRSPSRFAELPTLMPPLGWAGRMFFDRELCIRSLHKQKRKGAPRTCLRAAEVSCKGVRGEGHVREIQRTLLHTFLSVLVVRTEGLFVAPVWVNDGDVFRLNATLQVPQRHSNVKTEDRRGTKTKKRGHRHRKWVCLVNYTETLDGC